MDKKTEALMSCLEVLRKVTNVFLDTEGSYGYHETNTIDQVYETIEIINKVLAEQPAQQQKQVQPNWNLVYLHNAMEYIRENHPNVYAECGDTDEFRADRISG